MKTLADNSVDAIVTDPPYGLKFMNKGWDYEVPKKEIWAEALRVLKPGGHLLSFGGTRTYHRLVVAIEDAGFEIRDQIQWLYGSGFPKSHNLKDEHKGFGTALKPANEPICLARKPLSESTVAENVERWGTGAINIDASRIGTETISTHGGGDKLSGMKGNGNSGIGEYREHQGRWPANIILDEAAAEMLDEQSGELTSGKLNRESITAENKTYGNAPKKRTGKFEANSGGASRFFYVAKASKRERNAGLDGMPEKKNDFQRESSGLSTTTVDGVRQKSNCGKPNQNHHPTVKPIKLMEYLIRLITPPNGTVLDPFMGSGSTGVAAKNLKFKFIGIEMNEEYIEIAKRRVNE